MLCKTENEQKLSYIKGSDKLFLIRVLFSGSQNPKDLSAFVGETGNALALKLSATTGTIEIDLTGSTEGQLEVVSVAEGLAGKVQVTINDTSTLEAGKNQNMELVIREGVGPDFDVTIVQFKGVLDVVNSLF